MESQFRVSSLLILYTPFRKFHLLSRFSCHHNTSETQILYLQAKFPFNLLPEHTWILIHLFYHLFIYIPVFPIALTASFPQLLRKRYQSIVNFILTLNPNLLKIIYYFCQGLLFYHLIAYWFYHQKSTFFLCLFLPSLIRLLS